MLKEIWFSNIKYIQSAYAIIWLGLMFISWVNMMDFLFTIELFPVPNLIPDLFPQCAYGGSIKWVEFMNTLMYGDNPYEYRIKMLSYQDMFRYLRILGLKSC